MTRPPCMLVAGCVLAMAGAAGCSAGPPMLPEHQLCELWIAHELRAITDLSERRLGLRVRCEAPVQGRGAIVVTLALADGEAPPPDAAVRDLERRMATALETIVERRGWRVRYPSRTVEYVR